MFGFVLGAFQQELCEALGFARNNYLKIELWHLD
jgi:hypothetical protein